MRFQHTIEACNNAEDPVWYVVVAGDDAEEHAGTAAQYGREVLKNWIDDPGNWGDDAEPEITDEYGSPYLRVVVHFGDDEERDSQYPVATIGADDLEEPPAEIAAVEAARDAKLHARHLDYLADERLEEALHAARAAGHGANALARMLEGAVSRPVALRMMR
ncbi:hypothetical protein [Streptomyces nanshensis]|uniref:Uncharacterized protein n=1 Tax=Streptomyces nanshensis TaxID=518642 RepID=A0A1E7L2X6_9ACTN|nr:hypothetical protein [Streptomyces nanshensis]OEV10546.1 hypothetical protein AN218_16945 [Streptomyces nanshensis]